MPPKPRPSPWTPAAISALGYKPDVEIAAMIGVTKAAVSAKRQRLGILSAGVALGRKPTRGTPADRRVTVWFTADEMTAAVEAAGDLTPGKWLHKLAMEAVKREE